MKIGIIISNLGLGGAQRIALALAHWLLENGNDVDILSLKNIKTNTYDTTGLNIINVSEAPRKGLMFKLYYIAKDKRYDICLCMGVPMCVYTIIPLKIINGTKIIVSERNDPVHFLGKKSVASVARFLMRFADGYVFQTEDAKNFYDKALNKRGVVIPNPILTENLPEPYTGKRAKKIVAVGRLVEQKNYNLLIEAFSEFHLSHQEVALEIYGDGSLKEELQRSICNHGIENSVKVLGATNDIYERIKDASAFVLCSNFEGIPNALMEAMALGIPSISTDCPCGGPRMLITNHVNGVLVPVSDKDKLIDELENLIDNPDFAEKVSAEAIKIREEYDVCKICPMWFDYFKHIVS